MNDLEKLDLLGGIDPIYINEAAKDAGVYRRRLRRDLITAAACICLVAVGLIIHGTHVGKQQPVTANDQTAPETTNAAAAGETQPSASDEPSGTIYNGAEIPGDDTVYNGAEVPDDETIYNGAEVPDDKTVYNGANVPGDDRIPGNDDQTENIRFISSYGDPGYDPDLTVENGKIVMSDALKAALDEFGDDENVRYRVEMIFFNNGTKASYEDEIVLAEEKRLISDGYTVSTEAVSYEGELQCIYWILHASADQLRSLTASPDLGYYIVLYDEYTGLASETDVVYNGANQP